MKMKRLIVKGLLSVIVMLVMSFIVSVMIAYPLIENKNNLYHESTMYNNTTFDFLVPQPSDAQVVDFKDSTNYSSVIAYYMFSTDIKSGSKTINYNLILLDDFAELNSTPYSDERVIARQSFQPNSIALDYQLSKLLNVSLSDKVQIVLSSTEYIEFKVDAIYENNDSIYGSAVVALFDGDIKDYILANRNENNPLEYQGAYLTAVNEQLAWQELSTYQPLATLRTRDEFTSDLAYQNYLDLFNSTDYTTQIYHKTNQAQLHETNIIELEKLVETKGQTMVFAIIGSFLVLCIVVLGYTIVDLKNRRINVNLISETIQYSVIMLIGTVAYTLGMLVITQFYSYHDNYQIYAYTTSYLSSHIFIFVGMYLAVSFIGMFVIKITIKPNIDKTFKKQDLEVLILKSGRTVRTLISKVEVSDVVVYKQMDEITFEGIVVEGSASVQETIKKHKQLLQVRKGDKVYPISVIKQGEIKVQITKVSRY